MSILVDARGRSCPEPVMMTKSALEENKGQTIEVTVDFVVAMDNIKRYVEKEGHKVDIKEDGEDFILTIKG